MSKYAYYVSGANAVASRIINPMMKSIASPVSGKVADLEAMADNPSPTKNDAANFMQRQSGAKQLSKASTDALNQAGSVMRESKLEIQKRIDAKINLKSDPRYDGPIISRIASMNNTEKLRAMHDLAMSNDGQTLASILDAPNIATGVTNDMKASAHSLIIETHAPEEVKELAALDTDFKTLMTLDDLVTNFVQALSDPTRMGAINLAESKAASATAAFNS